VTLRFLILTVTAALAASSTAMALSYDVGIPWLIGLSGLVLLPLALLAPGFWRGHLTTYRVGAIVSVFYVGFALTEAVAQPDRRWLSSLVLLAATALIALLILAIRRTAAQRSSSAHPE
jgi:uncharacterized membrane protein